MANPYKDWMEQQIRALNQSWWYTPSRLNRTADDLHRCDFFLTTLELDIAIETFPYDENGCEVVCNKITTFLNMILLSEL